MQQHLPFTVLKLNKEDITMLDFELQQHLPFTVLKLTISSRLADCTASVATALTVYGIETKQGGYNNVRF